MTSFRRALIPSFFLLALPFVASAHDEPEHLPHLRPLDRDMQALVASGMRESSSFRALVEQINASDVVVYIRCGRTLRSGLSGQLTFVGASAGLRYVVVAIEPEDLVERKIATLGHELMHAVEIANTPAIVDAQSLGEEVRAVRQGGTRRHELRLRHRGGRRSRQAGMA
jgi:hypothetical protein